MANQKTQSVIHRLTEYRRQIEELMELIAGKHSLTRQEKAEARSRMKALKERLKEDHRSGNTLKGKAEMTRVEKQHFYPAVHEAYCHIRSAWNSHPIDSEWFDQLYDCQVEINFSINQLETGERHLFAFLSDADIDKGT